MEETKVEETKPVDIEVSTQPAKPLAEEEEHEERMRLVLAVLSGMCLGIGIGMVIAIMVL